MTSEKQAGFSLLEVIVSTAILFSEEGQGEWTGEELEIIFEGEEEDASEIFGKYIVTSEGGDSMTYYKRGFQ